MKIKANEICKIIEGKLIGNPNINISSFSNIENAKKGDITFLADMRYKKYIESRMHDLKSRMESKYSLEIMIKKYNYLFMQYT